MDILKKVMRSKVFLGLCLPVALGVIFIVAFAVRCNGAQPNFRPVQEPVSSMERSVEDGIANYRRPEETTYLTYPEWYLVFTPQEYARFLDHNQPSQFSYFASIGQLWSGYCQVYGITKNNYPFNAQDHLVEGIIATSFTVEFAVKGVYENTIGRISELFAGGAQTQEDVYAAQVAHEYGDFIPFEPWYAFPFGRALRGLWKDTSLWGPHPLRKWERKVALSLEYGTKALYAKLIGFGTHATLGVADSEIYAHVKNAPWISQDPKVRTIKELADGSLIVAIPHYQGFTDAVPTLAQKGLQFIDLAGNDEILMTSVVPANWTYDLKSGSELFTMPIMTDRSLKRAAIQVPVKSLSDMLNELRAEGLAVEHLFDY